MLRFIQYFPSVFSKAFSILSRSNPLILAGSTAFFATFSLPPIIIILVNTFGLYFQSDTIRSGLFSRLNTTLGVQVARQIEIIVNNFISLESNSWITSAGFVFFIFVATTLLLVIQQSIHLLWHIAPKATNKMRVSLIERGKAALLILSIGFLFLASLLLDGSLALLKIHLHDWLAEYHVYPLQVLNIFLSVFMIIGWFTTLLKFLPDVDVDWEVAFAGGTITGLFFNIGKVILGKVLVYSNIVTVFGASASFALILLFIFYSSFIVYFGAAFTFAYGLAIKKPIRPSRYADQYEETLLPLESKE